MGSQYTCELLRKAKELFQLKEIGENSYGGLLYPIGGEGGVFPYRNPALGIYFLVKKVVVDSDTLKPVELPNNYEFFGCIHSIDDSGISIFGPAETKERSIEKLNKFKKFIEEMEFKCPNKNTLEKACEKIGIFANYW